MASPKFRQYFNEMFDNNRELFLQFKLLCDDYAKDRQKYKEEFDRVGAEVVTIIKDTERRLCGYMERGKNATFSAKLADKFWEEVRAYFPPIDQVGVKILFKK